MGAPSVKHCIQLAGIQLYKTYISDVLGKLFGSETFEKTLYYSLQSELYWASSFRLDVVALVNRPLKS